MAATVLICDDDSAIRTVLNQALGRAGYDVRCASDGEEAWSEIQRSCPDLLLTDCQMPRLDGISLCRRLRASPEYASLPVMMLTAKGYELRSELEELKILGLIAKPFSPRELLDRVNAVLGVGEPVVTGAVT